jgi:hypothetical protein
MVRYEFVISPESYQTNQYLCSASSPTAGPLHTYKRSIVSDALVLVTNRILLQPCYSVAMAPYDPSTVFVATLHQTTSTFNLLFAYSRIARKFLFSLLFIISTAACQVGQYYNGISCINCPANTYSVPPLSGQCFKCPPNT